MLIFRIAFWLCNAFFGAQTLLILVRGSQIENNDMTGIAMSMVLGPLLLLWAVVAIILYVMIRVSSPRSA